MVSTLPISIFLILVGVVSIIFYGQYLFTLARQKVRLVYTSEGKWLFEDKNITLEGTLRGDSTVTPYVSVLRWQINGQKSVKNLIIFRDSLSKNDYRQLMVIIRMY